MATNFNLNIGDIRGYQEDGDSIYKVFYDRNKDRELYGVTKDKYNALYDRFELYENRLKELGDPIILPPKTTDEQIQELLTIVKAQQSQINELKGGNNEPKSNSNGVVTILP